ncbi:MAG: hypothetical protein WAK17_18525 [Candidatus Nitrosopolaris sp.]
MRFDNDCSNTFVATPNIQQVGFFPSMMDATDIGPFRSVRRVYLTDVSVFCMPVRFGVSGDENPSNAFAWGTRGEDDYGYATPGLGAYDNGYSRRKIV